ncbi:TetR/AcrR family transcriptional regulator C-terminal domain-containing protein [Micromonospora sp. NBC_00421]|uniref:TetR/AcrR family transcriptional regulator C-terminal domain-containing protein n=1 Tax=Micromonospora sp. NBC_00421 TaxID=2975976 RepID=UPI003FA527B1
MPSAFSESLEFGVTECPAGGGCVSGRRSRHPSRYAAVGTSSRRRYAHRVVLGAALPRHHRVCAVGRSRPGPDRLTKALADRFDRPALGGRSRISDPVLAAEQFLALITGPLESRSCYGNRSVSAQKQRVVTPWPPWIRSCWPSGWPDASTTPPSGVAGHSWRRRSVDQRRQVRARQA